MEKSGAPRRMDAGQDNVLARRSPTAPGPNSGLLPVVGLGVTTAELEPARLPLCAIPDRRKATDEVMWDPGENGPTTEMNPDDGSVEDWHDCNDPAELRIRLEVALEENAELRAGLAEVRIENLRLRTRLGMPADDTSRALPPVPEPPAPTVTSQDGHSLPYADAASAAETKIALFRALFAGREDVYATRWVSARTGRTGWSPAEDNPFAKNKNDTERVF